MKWIAKKSKRARAVVIGVAICSAAALMLIPTTSGAADPIFADDFSSGRLRELDRHDPTDDRQRDRGSRLRRAPARK